MLQNLCIKNKSPKTGFINIGELAESLIFYDKVSVFINHHTLADLLQRCGKSEIEELIQNGNLEISLNDNHLGISESSNNKNQVLFGVEVLKATNDKHLEILQDAFEIYYKKHGKSRREALKYKKFTKPYLYDFDIREEIAKDILDFDLIKQIAYRELGEFYDTRNIAYNNFEFEFERDKGRAGFYYKLITNINIEAINNNYKVINPESTNILTPAGILLNIAECKGDLDISSKLDSDILLSPNQIEILNLKFEQLFRNASKSKEQINLFQEYSLPQFKKISEVINSGEKDFKSLLKLIEKAEKFKSWKREISDDKDIIAEYFKAIKEDSWIDKLPAKTVRWSFFTTAGIVADLIATGGLGTLVGTGIGAVDSFVIDKLIKGWKPNQFINTSLRKFVK